MADDPKPPDPPVTEPTTPQPQGVKVAQVPLPIPPAGAWLWVIGILEADGRFRYASCPILPVRNVQSAGFRHEILEPGLQALQQQLGAGPLISLN